MSELTVVEFESKTFGNSYISELSDGPPFTVHGVALGAGDVTVGQSGIKKKWPASELQTAADSLRGTDLVVDHDNDATGVVGRVTKSGYKEETGVVYEAELFDEELAEKIKNGLLEVSIRGFHADVDSLEEDEETDAKIVEDIEFDNLSIVPTGAAPSNTLQMGEHAELSAAELSAFTDSLEAAELAEIEPGMWVTTGDTNGITISAVRDGEVEVDIYEESDGKWRSTGETEMFDVDSLDEWDVDEEEDIGAREDEESEDEDEEENASILDAGMEFFDAVNDTVLTIVGVKGDMVEIQGEDGSEWSEKREDIFEKIAQGEWRKAGHDEADEELVAIDDKVEWDNGAAQGIVRERKTDGCFNEKIDGDFEICADDDEAVLLIEIVKDGEATGTMVAHKENTLHDADFEMSAGEPETPDGDTPDSMRDDATGGIQAPDWQDGQMVKWQVNPRMRGKIVHVDREKKVLMVEVMEDTEQGLQPTGYTLTAGFQDVVPMDQEAAATSTRDMPTQDAEPTHDTGSVDTLLSRFIEESDTDEPTLADFAEWMESENLAVERGEGEEEILDSDADLDSSHEGEPHRYIDADDEQLAESFDDYPEAAAENAQMALDAKEETGNPNDCGTDVGWKRANQLASGESISRKQLGKMAAFARHEGHSEMDDEEGRADCGWMMWKAWGGDEGVGWAQRKLDKVMEENSMDDVPDDMRFKNKEDAQEKADDLGLDGAHEMDGRWMPGETHKELMDHMSSNSKHGDDSEDEEGDEEEMASTNEGESVSEPSDVEELEEYDFHEVSWDGTTESDWSTPNLEDFPQMDGDSEWDDLSGSDKEAIGMHFLISSSGFPADEFGDMKLPVVEPNGDLNVNALAAVKGGRGTSAVEGLSDEMGEEIDEYVNSLANDPDLFDRNWGKDKEENVDAEAQEIGGTAGRPTASKTVGGVKVLSGDDLRQTEDKSEESDVDELTTITTMTNDIEEKLSELDEPAAVEAAEIEELRDKADRFEEMSENLEALRERTDILDEVDRSQVEELAEAEDPVVKESARYEELTSEAEQVAGVYAAQLAEEYPAFSAEELTNKFSIEELREKFEEQIGDVEEELASSEEAEPRSQDAGEESLEEAADETDESSEENLSDEAAQKQEELLNKITGGR